MARPGLLLACALFGAAGAAGPPDAKPSIRPDTMAGLVAVLRAGGAGGSRQGAVEQPFFSVPGTFVTVHGEGVQVFEYSDAKTAGSEAGRVSADGMTVGTTKPHWMVPPHFYRSGRLIVLYLGTDPKVLEALQDALGEPFAGSR